MMRPQYLRALIGPMLLGASLSALSCTDKRHDCDWLANCDGDSDGPDAAGGAVNSSTAAGGAGGALQTNEGGATSRSSTESGTAGGSVSSSSSSVSAGGAVGGGAGNASGAAGIAGAGVAGTHAESAGSAGWFGAAGAAGAAGTTERACTGNPNDGNCAIDPKYGVFVSPLGDDELGAGTPENPFRTLAAGLLAAKQTAPRNVYLCADTATQFELSAPLELTSDNVGDVSVFGGFSCTGGERWTYDAKLQARIVAQTPVALKFLNISSSVYIENVSIVAADATKDGESSIAVLAVQSPRLSFHRVNIDAGRGMKGANGDRYTNFADEGIMGKDGVEACSTGLGGEAVTKQCEGTAFSKSGQGGSGIPTFQSNGGKGSPDYPSPSGDGGYGENGPLCKNGNDGSRGSEGVHGDGGVGAGWLSIKAGYIPIAGKVGSTGTPGQGGGGGGGAAPPETCLFGAPAYGASGASGGSGGCGGKGGSPGLGGGASIALALINSPVQITNSTLHAKDGGAGGDGGPGQTGGSGKSGGSPKSGLNSHESCGGGRGGQGGMGGRGGGGAGGASVAIAYVGDAPVQTEVTATTATIGAPGGVGLGSDTANGSGETGRTATLLEFQLAPEN